jgi:hypothetical protein
MELESVQGRLYYFSVQMLIACAGVVALEGTSLRADLSKVHEQFSPRV